MRRLLRDSDGDLVSVHFHNVTAEGSAGLWLSVGYDVSAVVDYPPLAIASDYTVVSRSLYETVFGKDGAVRVVVGVFGPLEITQIVGGAVCG